MNSPAIRATAAQAIPRSDAGSGLSSIGVFFLCVFLFLTFSRVGELFFAPLRLPLITSLIALLMTVFTGGVPRALFSRSGAYLTAFSLWLVVAVPFSYWPGGSVQLLREQWIKSFMVFVIVAGVPRSGRDCRYAMYAIALSVAVIVVLALSFGVSPEERLILDRGVLANPNDLAQLLLLGLPFLFLMRLNPTLMTNVATGISIVGVLFVVARTGSRGALVTLAAVLMVILIGLSWRNRVKVICGLALAAVMVIPYVSEEQWARYATLVSDSQGPEAAVGSSLARTEEDAVGSSLARMELLRQSVQLTIEHPLTGIGPGIFQAASADLSQRQGQQGIWHDTHNTYTQVSSEAGLPALGFFLGVLITSLSSARRVYVAARADQSQRLLANNAYCLWMSLIVYAVSANFASVAYLYYLPALAGLARALTLSAQAELAAVPSRVAWANPPLRYSGRPAKGRSQFPAAR